MLKSFFITVNDETEVDQCYGSAKESWDVVGWQNYLRGFYWPKSNELYFYTSEDTRNYVSVVRQFDILKYDIMTKLNCNDRTIIHGGLIPGEKWQSVRTFGVCSEFSRRAPRTDIIYFNAAATFTPCRS